MECCIYAEMFRIELCIVIAEWRSTSRIYTAPCIRHIKKHKCAMQSNAFIQKQFLCSLVHCFFRFGCVESDCLNKYFSFSFLLSIAADVLRLATAKNTLFCHIRARLIETYTIHGSASHVEKSRHEVTRRMDVCSRIAKKSSKTYPAINRCFAENHQNLLFYRRFLNLYSKMKTKFIADSCVCVRAKSLRSFSKWLLSTVQH